MPCLHVSPGHRDSRKPQTFLSRVPEAGGRVQVPAARLLPRPLWGCGRISPRVLPGSSLCVRILRSASYEDRVLCGQKSLLQRAWGEDSSV